VTATSASGHTASFCCVAKRLAYWANNGQRPALGLIGLAANDPKRTFEIPAQRSLEIIQVARKHVGKLYPN
jgi:hypothetical protein